MKSLNAVTALFPSVLVFFTTFVITGVIKSRILSTPKSISMFKFPDDYTWAGLIFDIIVGLGVTFWLILSFAG